MPAAGLIMLELAGEPKGKARPRFVKATGHAFTPAATRSYESALRLAGQDAMGGDPPLDGPVAVMITALFPIPVSWSKKKRAAAISGLERPTTKPDADNLFKMLDALNEVVWRDDKQIVEGYVSKSYSERPALLIEVKAIGEGAI